MHPNRRRRWRGQTTKECRTQPKGVDPPPRVPAVLDHHRAHRQPPPMVEKRGQACHLPWMRLCARPRDSVDRRTWAHVAGRPGEGARAAGARGMPAAIGHGPARDPPADAWLVMIDYCRPLTTARPRSAATVDRCSSLRYSRRASEISGLRQRAASTGLPVRGACCRRRGEGFH